MARTFRRRQSLTALSEINLTPLIDLAFALLIIFMITTPLLEQSITLQLPMETQRPQDTRDDSAVETIQLQADGTLYWGAQPVSMERLDQLLATAAAAPTAPIISIRADQSLPYQQIVDVIDLVKKHNLTRISLDTQIR